MALSVLYADEQLIAVDKPAGQLVIPGRGAPERTLLDDVREAFGRLWVVHRLDRGTSGVVLFPRTAEAHRTLNLAFDRREVAKRYLALVRGAPPAEARIEVPIAPARRGRLTFPVAEPEKAIAALVDAIVDASTASGKPPIIVSQEKLDVDSVRHTAIFQEKCWQAGMPVYPTAGRAAAATSRLLSWRNGR